MLKKISIEGMSCNKCVAHVKEALECLEGANRVEVVLAEKYAVLDTSATAEQIKEAIEDEGYDVISIEDIQ